MQDIFPAFTLHFNRLAWLRFKSFHDFRGAVVDGIKQNFNFSVVIQRVSKFLIWNNFIESTSVIETKTAVLRLHPVIETSAFAQIGFSFRASPVICRKIPFCDVFRLREIFPNFVYGLKIVESNVTVSIIFL